MDNRCGRITDGAISPLEMGESQPLDELPAVTESAYLGITRDREDDQGRIEFCLVYADHDGMQECWLAYPAYHKFAAATREKWEASYSRFRVMYEMREDGLKREKVRAEVALSKKAPEKKTKLGGTDMGKLIKNHYFPRRIQPGVLKLLKIPYLKLFATDKEELLDQVRSYAFSKGAVAGTEDDEEEVWAQIGRSADVLVISETESGGKTFTVTRNTMFDRSVLTEYKGQDKTDGAFVSTYWDDELESVEPLFALKFTDVRQLKYLKEVLSAAEIAAINGYNETRLTEQTAHSGGGWPTTTPESPDGVVMIIYRGVFQSEADYDAFFERKGKRGNKAGNTNRTQATPPDSAKKARVARCSA